MPAGGRDGSAAVTELSATGYRSRRRGHLAVPSRRPAYRAGRGSDADALTDALRTTTITDNVTIGTVQFNTKGQNESVRCAAAQNRGGRLVVVAPRGSADSEPIWPMRAWDKKA